MRLVGSAEMRAIDRAAIDGLGVPAAALMERAGAAVAAEAALLLGPGGRVQVVCGGGNNGGDGYVAARQLHARRPPRGGARAGAGRAGSPRRRGHARGRGRRRGADRRRRRAPRAHRRPRPGDVVVDALLGTGLCRAPEGAFAEAIAAIAAARAAGARVLAVDVPSGLSADTGRPLGPCVRADRTVTFAFPKRGLVVYPGASLAGRADRGRHRPPCRKRRGGCRSEAEVLDEDDARALVPPRGPEAHKGDAGRLLVVAGSAGKTGAAHLALSGALRGGAGLVTLAARADALAAATAGRPEAMSIGAARARGRSARMTSSRCSRRRGGWTRW